MRDGSHKTVVGIMREAVETWRKRERWSQMAVVQAIVDVHEGLALDALTEIHFEHPTSGRDAYRCMQTNAERVYRWLDDVSKPNNLLPASFMPSILAALPMDLRLDAANQLLVQAGLAAYALNAKAPRADVTQILQAVAREGGEATVALVDLLDGATKEELRAAQIQLADSAEATRDALHHVEFLLANGK